MAAWAVVIRSEAEGSVGEMFGDDQVRFSLTKRDMQNARKGLKTLCEMMFAHPDAHEGFAAFTEKREAKFKSH